MSDKIKALALFETTLADKITSSADAMTLVTGTDKKGTALSGIYGLTLDEGNSNEEFIIATIAATAVTGATRGIDVADGVTEVTALKYTHARGASVKITNFPLLGIIMGYINDSNALPAPLKYDTDVVISDARDLVYKSYADAIATTGITAFAVSDAGGITVDVNSGTYVVNGYVGTYAGVSGQSLTDDETNYIQFKDRALDINITGFEDDAIPLATVICASADISSVTDNRPFITYTDIKDSSGLERDSSGIYIDLDTASILEFSSGKLSFPAVSSHTDNTAGYLTGGASAQSAFASWAAITDGSFRFKIDGGALQNIDGIDFSGDGDMDAVAATIQSAIQTATSSTETCVWDTDHFIITSATLDEDSEISVLTTSTGTVGTDISGAGADDWLDADTGNGTATQGTSDHNKAIKLNTDGEIEDNFISENIRSKKTLTAGETIDGATLPVAVYQDASDNKIYACDGDDNSKLDFIGFAVSNGTDGNDITIQFDGPVSGFTGLDEDSIYYLQDDKTIANNDLGTNTVIVGRAISETELLITKENVETIASDTLQISNDAEKMTEELTYTKLKEILVENDLQKYRIKFNLRNSGGFTCNGKIYLNGVAIGTQRTESSGDTTYSEDFTIPIKKGDLLQIYAKVNEASVDAYIKEFRIYWDYNLIEPPVNSTNQDPV